MQDNALTSNDILIRSKAEQARLARERAAAPTSHTLESLLDSVGLTELADAFTAKSTLNDLQSRLAANRPHFLAFVRELGVDKLPDRQKLAVAISKAEKAGQIPSASMKLPHLRPPVFEEDRERVSVWLKVPAGTSTNQLKMHLDANTLRVEYLGEPTAVGGRLCGLVLPTECDWQLERAAAAEYDPLIEATEQPPPPDDTMLISLTKARPGSWTSLFSDAVARRHVPPLPKVDEAARALKEERQKALDKRKHEMLYGKDITPLPPKRPELVRLEERERTERRRRRERRAEDVAQGTPTLSAKEHWQPALATLVWREGLARLEGEPEHPAESGPLFRWVEDAKTLVLSASTSRGLPATALKLSAGTNFVECSVRGVASLWSGVLVGKVDPALCTLEVVPSADADAACDTLQLTLVKAEPRRLWLAPWPELLESIDRRERRSAAHRDVPRREELKAAGGWDEVQRPAEWELVIPFRSGGNLTHDDLRVGVTADTLNVHVAGQQDAPLVGGELGGRLLPARCSWRVRTAKAVGSVLVDEIVLTLVKEHKASWPRLFKRMYE